MNLSETIGGAGKPRVADLHAAFRVFTDATANLEREYRRLQEQARRLESELAQKNRALEASLDRNRELEERARQRDRLTAMGEMAATLAHEVRNPLGGMELFARLLESEVAEIPSAQRLARHIAGGVRDLDHLVTNLLEFTRLPEPQRMPVRVDEWIEEAIFLSGLSRHEKISVEVLGGEELVWNFDRGLLVRALLNLLRNAAEAMPEGGRVEISAGLCDRGLRIDVRDDGPGVSAEDAERIFDAFVTTRQKGTGLGLATAAAAARSHGGSLTLEPSDRGARFRIELPDAEAPVEECA